MASRDTWNQIACNILAWFEDLDDLTTMECSIQTLLKKHVEDPDKMEPLPEVSEEPQVTPLRKHFRQTAAIGRLALWLVVNAPEEILRGNSVDTAIAYLDKLHPPKGYVSIPVLESDLRISIAAMDHVLQNELIKDTGMRDALWAFRKHLRSLRNSMKEAS